MFQRPFRIFSSVLQSGQNGYGHSALKYGTESLDIVMNISGKGDKLVNFFDSHTYFFVTPKEKNSGNRQGGIAKRSFITFRIDNLPIEVITEQLHPYFLNLQIQGDKGEAKFTLIAHLFTNFFRRIFKSAGIAERGNCSYWTSKGLKEGGFLKHHSNWPLLIFFRLLARKLIDNDTENINIISYRSLNFRTEQTGAWVYPFFFFVNTYRNIWNLERFANIIVKPKKINDDYIFDITKNERARKEFWVKVQKDLLKIKKIRDLI